MLKVQIQIKKQRIPVFLRVLLIFSVLLLASQESSAQFKRLGDKLKKGVSKLVEKEVEENDARTDSVKFNYAISLSDNSTLFETRDFLQKNQQVISGVLFDSSDDDASEDAETWINYGENFYSASKFKSAEFSFHAAKLIYEEEGDTLNLDYFRVLSNLGLIYHATGRFNLAEEYTRLALTKREEQLGKESGGYAASLNNLAVLYKDRGEFNEAEKLFDESLSINERSLGENSLGHAIILNNMAMLYQTVGRYDDALDMINESLDIAGEEIGESTGRYQKLMVNKALLLQDIQKFDEAEEVYQEAIRLKERRFGKNHPDYAHMLMNLASLYVEMDKPEEVEELLQEAIDIYINKFGNQSLQYASAISNLGNFYRYQGRYDEAETLLIRTLDLREDKLGVNNPLFVKSKENLAINYWKKGEVEKASELFVASLDQSIDFIHSYFPPMSEIEKTMYWDKLHPSFQRFYDFVSESWSQKPELLKHALNYRLATKALLMSATSKIRNKILNSGDRGLIEDYLSWVDHKEMLSRYYAYSKEEIREENINLDSIEEVTNDLERSLSERSNLFASGYKLTEHKYKDLLQIIKTDEAIIEMIKFRDFDKSFTDQVHYLGLVIRTDNDGTPEAVLLENGNQLEGRYLNYYRNAVHQKVEDEYSYDQYWSEIQIKLSGINKVYFSPDGVYNQINVNTLNDPDGTYIIEKLNLILIGNAREVLELKEYEKRQSILAETHKAYIFGFPEYGNDDKLAPLPGTKEEALQISQILEVKKIKPVVYLQDNADEENLKEINNPDMIHIATHGYFLEDVENLSSEKVFGIQAEKAKDNPLLRSGLFFSGSADLMDGYNTSNLEDRDNGILTAYEAMNLPLDNAEIVVLSACQTGLGNVKTGEGVYGLQRAFLVAGSKALIMSLWKVNDEATQELMTDFYSRWVRSGNKLSAFKNAQLALKEKYNDPYFWGAFVMIGA